ncbi:MAG: M23 family metallopeptidase [Clostridiales bacterium]|jgi:murein DD-endopeptidase MepM/ murein hydrolase activator NlpD|nr:M23 family metallopeptidase [Clostridiales bacterium]
MAEKPKNAKRTGKRSKGFYAAVYGGIGGLLVLAVAIGYYSLISPGDSGLEIGEVVLPVGGTMDVPIANIPQPTPPRVPTPQTQPPSPISSPEAHSPPETMPQDNGGQPTRQEVYEPTIYEIAEQYVPDITHEVLGPTFVEFTENDDMHWPVLGEILMDFSTDVHIFDIALDQWRVNDSISIRAERGEAVRAAAAGIVGSVENTPESGAVVVIDHGNGWTTTYRQLDPHVTVAVGDVVSLGQIIGNVGTPSILARPLGYHVGFSVRADGQAINPHTVLSAMQ